MEYKVSWYGYHTMKSGQKRKRVDTWVTIDSFMGNFTMVNEYLEGKGKIKFLQSKNLDNKIYNIRYACFNDRGGHHHYNFLLLILHINRLYR